MCNWMSFYKQNTFHIHMSDNLYNNVRIYSLERQMELYAAFRPWSDDPALDGLNKRQNESYTREQFDKLQRSCAARGVTIIPEIEAPGHALVISQWKPELAIDTSIDLLNISYPDTIPTMKTIWKTLLPWFHSKVVHIGADEYVDPVLTKDALVSYYNDFVITLNDFIQEESGKQIRIWGTFPPKDNYTNNIPQDVAIQHWAQFEDNPYFDYIENGYNVINSDDSFYIVQKYSVPYPQQLNKTRIFHGNPGDGGPWSPNIFDVNNATNNPPRTSPFVLGHLAAQWNDYGPNTSTYLEAYHPWRYYGAALADKQWGGDITEEEYDLVFPILQAAAPAQNLDRSLKSQGSTILEYKFADGFAKPAARGVDVKRASEVAVEDLSGNAYHATTSCGFSAVDDGHHTPALSITNECSVNTPLTSKGNDYTLSFAIRQLPSSKPGPIFTGPDSELWSGNGTSTQIMVVSAGNAFALNYSLPVGEWVNASLIGRGNQTFFSVATQDGGDGEEMEFTTTIGINGESFA
ncbi:glycoside hydrolase superfamily [Microdochium trichocladiopsis]|uniref:beta-N-acetylhexosaminidase n=1 Tax=Microdochium trichocladiopsis TaxID=1682393 RepID=A0A9P8XYH8_9PEZI|nr:glycoside hydrolase superfamily [Microdochium trichocladiopsis]KAH7021360.1 glycoside hydrolase superfamily [Microdochium trichocladiopsis]